MIHKNSKDPVLVKKISLKGWKLSEEVRAEIKSRLEQNDEIESIINSLEKVFTVQKKPNLTLIASPKSDAEDVKADGAENNETIKIVQYTPEIASDQIFQCRAFLAEITMESIHFFCSETFIEGQSIVLQFQIPKPFIVNIEVVNSRAYSLNSRIISEAKLPYRIVGKFTFLKTGERALLRDFLSGVEPKSGEGITKVEAKAPENVAEDEGLDLAGLADSAT